MNLRRPCRSNSKSNQPYPHHTQQTFACCRVFVWLSGCLSLSCPWQACGPVHNGHHQRTFDSGSSFPSPSPFPASLGQPWLGPVRQEEKFFFDFHFRDCEPKRVFLALSLLSPTVFVPGNYELMSANLESNRWEQSHEWHSVCWVTGSSGAFVSLFRILAVPPTLARCRACCGNLGKMNRGSRSCPLGPSTIMCGCTIRSESRSS